MDPDGTSPAGEIPVTCVVTGPQPLAGEVRAPGDKSVSHRALILGWLASGTTRISGLSSGDDVVRTQHAVQALGATVGAAPDPSHTVEVHGCGEDASDGGGPVTVDVGNSGTAIRLLAGACASRPGTVHFTGDASLSSRPMDRIAVPLRRMGATIEGRTDRVLPPLTVTGGGLRGIDYDMPVASAQVRGAVLLAGLRASSTTSVRSPAPCRMHTEEMLIDFGARVEVDGLTSRVHPGRLQGADVDVPADPSQAAFWVVAALVCHDSVVTLPGVYLGPARAGFLDVLVRMGADIEVDRSSGTLQARSSRLHATEIGGAEIAGVIDEIPILMVAAAHAGGTTVVRDAAELRVKETDRVESMVDLLAAFGWTAQARPDGLVVEGGDAHDSDVDVYSRGDHRIAMAAAVAAMARPGVTTIHGWDAVGTSYPGFLADLRALGGQATS